MEYWNSQEYYRTDGYTNVETWQQITVQLYSDKVSKWHDKFLNIDIIFFIINF